MMTSSINIDLSGLQELAKTALAKAQRAVKPMADEMIGNIKGNAPEQSGALKDSITAKYLTKEQTAIAVIGPDVGYLMTYGNITKAPYAYAMKEDVLVQFLSANTPKADQLANYVRQEFNE